MPRRRRALAAGLVLLGLVAAGCGSGSSDDADRRRPAVAGAAGRGRRRRRTTPRSASRVEDSVYPDVGDPSVDALHYSLDLTWDAAAARLTATETVLFRATTTADHVQLDLARQLFVEHVWLDGKAVAVPARRQEPRRLRAGEGRLADTSSS